MSRDPHRSRSTTSHPYYYDDDHVTSSRRGNRRDEVYWEDEDVNDDEDGHYRNQGGYTHQHYHRNIQPSSGRRVGGTHHTTITSSSPQRHASSGYVDEDDTTGDGSSSVISYSSGYGRGSGPPKSTDNGQNRRNYQEPRVRIHYVPQHRSTPNRISVEYPQTPGRMPDIPEKFRDEKDGSEMYVTDSTLMKQQRPQGSMYSHYSGKSRAPSDLSSAKTKTSRKGGVVVETMAAPNPFCPNTKGLCCLMVLVNLGLILVTLGFSIVLQLYDPPFVWYCGIAFLIVGFIGLAASLVFCVYLCRESREKRRAHGAQPGELYWTHHWQKRIPIPGMGNQGDREKDDLSTVYSTRTDFDDSHRQFYPPSDPRQHHQPHISTPTPPNRTYRS